MVQAGEAGVQVPEQRGVVQPLHVQPAAQPVAQLGQLALVLREDAAPVHLAAFGPIHEERDELGVPVRGRQVRSDEEEIGLVVERDGLVRAPPLVVYEP